MFTLITDNKRTTLLGILTIIGVLWFWLGSRYPDLDRKSTMAQSATVADALTPWPLFRIDDTMSYPRKVGYATLNWLHANWKGMSFGILFGAAILTFFRYLSFTPSASRWRQILHGTLMGAPLGVCVNCATPVFRGTLQSGRVEMALSAMISSPTLNIVVLTMLLSLFPFYIAAAKLTAVFFCLFLIIPLLGKYFANTQHSLQVPQNTSWTSTGLNSCNIERSENWRQACISAAGDFTHSLWFIAIRTVPLMILAGLIGAAIAHALALDALLGESSLWHIAMASLIGTLLPVPMAFDIILVNALYHDGLSPGIIAALLATLGTFSILSFMVIWSVGLRGLSCMLLLGIIFTGVLTGVGAHWVHTYIYLPARVQDMQQEPTLRSPVTAIDRDSPTPSMVTSPPAAAVEFMPLIKTVEMSVSGAPYTERTVPVSGRFTRLEGQHIGIQRGYRFAVRDFVDPFWIGRGIAGGDYNDDGWVDVVLATSAGLELYMNRGGWFERQLLNHPKIQNMNIYAVAFVDLNNDGKLDLFFTSFNQGNHLLLNQDGRFIPDQLITVPNHQGIITVSPAFADFDGNGYLDIVNGNMALGVVTGSHDYGEGRANSIVFNDNLHFRDAPIESQSGETMTTLISDFNSDGHLDVYFGNDFVIPDTFLLGTGKGFKRATRSAKFVEFTPFFSMGADSGDVNNDLQLDLLLSGTTVTESFVGQQTIDGREPQHYSVAKAGTDACNTINDSVQRSNCLKTRVVDFTLYERRHFELSECQAMTEALSKQSCLLAVMWQLITRENAPVDCVAQFSADQVLLQACELLRRRAGRFPKEKLAADIRQDNRNILYVQGKDGLKDINSDGQVRFAHPGGWTWNARFADLDNDGWLDILNVEGSIRKEGTGWNVVMHNVRGEYFEEKSFSYGFDDAFNQFSFTLIDYDNDGDVDVIANSAEGPVRVYRNDIAQHNSITIALRDNRGNQFAVGAKIIIRTEDGLQQMREVKAGGGYQSFDTTNAIFGIGRATQITHVTVNWPDQTRSEITTPLAANHVYMIKRL